MAISCIPLAPQQSPWRVGGNSIHCVTVLGAIIHIWRPEIADGCDISSEKAMAPPPVLLPGKSHGRRSLVGCSP